MAATKKPKPIKIPKTIGACADRLYTVRQDRLERQGELKPLKAEETALSEHLIATLPASQASGVAGKLARVTIAKTPEATVEDWDLLYKHILKTKDFSLLGRRLSGEAVKERWDAGKKIPGVKLIYVKTVSLNKV